MTNAPVVSLVLAPEGLRRCGDCQLCCKLLPMPLPHYNKPAGERCRHQKHGTGCAIYARRPASCATWTCRWLTNDDTADLRRPDRSRYVIDVMPDFVTAKPYDGSAPYNIPVVQIWCDAKAPEAWRDPALLAYLDRRGKDGVAAIIRFDNKRAITLFPPSMTGDAFQVIDSARLGREHTFMEKVAAISSAPRIVPPKENGPGLLKQTRALSPAQDSEPGPERNPTP